MVGLYLLSPYVFLARCLINYTQEQFSFYMYVYETFKVKYRLRVFENVVLMRIFGSKREEVTGG
jgi:hypothetical protein